MGNSCCSDHRKNRELAEITSQPIQGTPLEKMYSSKKIIKIISNHAIPVFLLEDNIVRKDYSNPSNCDLYKNECESYRRLKALPFILKPIHISNNAIYLPYIPEKPPKTYQNEKIVDTYLNILKRDFHIGLLGKFHWENLLQCPKTKQIYIIGLNDIPWFPSTNHNTNWVIFDNPEYKSTRSISI